MCQITHDDINTMLILIAIIMVIKLLFTNNTVEHLIDMSLFDKGNGNYKSNLNSIKNEYPRSNDWWC